MNESSMKRLKMQTDFYRWMLLFSRMIWSLEFLTIDFDVDELFNLFEWQMIDRSIDFVLFYFSLIPSIFFTLTEWKNVSLKKFYRDSINSLQC